MARGAWDPTAHVLAMLANRWRDAEETPEPHNPIDFHPLRVSESRKAKSTDVLPYDPAVLIAIANLNK